MASGYLFPAITPLRPGYDCISPDPVDRLAERLTVPDCNVVLVHKVYFDGTCEHETTREVAYRDFKPQIAAREVFRWPDSSEKWKGGIGYLEVSVEEADRRLVFQPRFPVSSYVIYSKPGKKSFFVDKTFKYGVPPVIDMVARFGKFVDGHPLIHIDRKRDLGESLTLVNPYQKPLLATIMSNDGRRLPRKKVGARSAVQLPLVDLLRDDEDEWIGQIQLTANNRVIAYDVKHSLADPELISDHEHLDPFRAGDTKVPMTRLMRKSLGRGRRKVVQA
ncbi:MAG: hypothetical protein HOH89_00690 [Alphaproteobacteria bacterium]|nr:hypothetical protein [Alphaproteobacteria bacterium]